MFTLLAVILLYVVRRDVVVFERRVSVEPSARMHLALLIALLFLMTALRAYFVRLPDLLYSTTGPLVGASFADLHATLTGLRIAGVAALAGARWSCGARSASAWSAIRRSRPDSTSWSRCSAWRCTRSWSNG